MIAWTIFLTFAEWAAVAMTLLRFASGIAPQVVCSIFDSIVVPFGAIVRLRFLE